MSGEANASDRDLRASKAHEKGLIFKTIKEHRGKYFVEYVPTWPGGYFASLSVVILEHLGSSEIAEIMENECNTWIQRYPVPLMVTAFDDAESVIPLEGVRTCDHLIGLVEDGKLVRHWKTLKNEEFSLGPLREPQLVNIYDNVPCSTKEERRIKAVQRAKTIRLGILVIAAWGVAVPTLVAFLGFASPALGFIIVAYGIGKAIHGALKLLGYIKPSEHEKQTAEEELKMRHHHYHCERNPEAFLRLKVENFEREARENTQREAAELESLKRPLTS